MTSKVTYESMSDLIAETFPELRAQYREMLDEWGDPPPGPHVIYGLILNPYIISNLKTDGTEQALRSIFRFVERLARDEDLQVRAVVVTTVPERIGDDPSWLDRARQFMGEVTLELSREIESFWGRETSQGKDLSDP